MVEVVYHNKIAILRISEVFYMSLTSIETKYEHVVLDEKGVPGIAGTNMKVIELVLEKSA